MQMLISEVKVVNEEYEQAENISELFALTKIVMINPQMNDE